MRNSTLLKTLSTTVSLIKGNGAFYSNGKGNFILPGLKIGTDFEVPLPIQQDNVDKLIDNSIQAPYGKGNETLVNTKVRKTWEIDGSNISFGNQSWEKLLKKIVEAVKDDFSLQDIEVTPQLYKLLIYEEGGFFLKHKDTEKQKGMFASLIINLPSEFTGGELVIEWNGETI